MNRLSTGNAKRPGKWLLLLLSFVFLHCDHVTQLEDADSETGINEDSETETDSDTGEDTGVDTSPPEFGARGWLVPAAATASQKTFGISGGIAPAYATRKSTDGRFSVVHIGVTNQLAGQEGVTQ